MKIEISSDDEPRVLRAAAELLSYIAGEPCQGTTRDDPKETKEDLPPEKLSAAPADTETTTTATAGAAGSASENAATAVDLHGVPFDSDYCGTSADAPFYSSGPNEGQWKKRRGVAPADYEGWYAAEKKRLAPPATGSIFEETAPPAVDTAGAFGAPAAGGLGETTPPPTEIPTECGPFMGLVSEKIAAGAVTQAQVTDAYTACDLSVTDLFPPADPQLVASNIARLHHALFGV